MKTHVHEDSVRSYRGIELTRRQDDVVRVLQTHGPSTDLKIATALGYTVNRVTGRVAELIAKGVVVEEGSVVGDFGKNVRVSKLKAAPARPGLLFEP